MPGHRLDPPGLKKKPGHGAGFFQSSEFQTLSQFFAFNKYIGIHKILTLRFTSILRFSGSDFCASLLVCIRLFIPLVMLAHQLICHDPFFCFS